MRLRQWRLPGTFAGSATFDCTMLRQWVERTLRLASSILLCRVGASRVPNGFVLTAQSTAMRCLRLGHGTGCMSFSTGKTRPASMYLPSVPAKPGHVFDATGTDRLRQEITAAYQTQEVDMGPKSTTATSDLQIQAHGRLLAWPDLRHSRLKRSKKCRHLSVWLMNELNRTSPIPDAAAVAARLMAEFAMRTVARALKSSGDIFGPMHSPSATFSSYSSEQVISTIGAAQKS